MSRNLLVTAVLAVGAGAGSFLLGQAGSASRAPERPRAHGSACCCAHPSLCNWLRLSDEQCELIRQADPKFSQEATPLLKNMEQERDGLARLVETTSSTDVQITDRIERLIAAHDALERRVAKHLLAIRGLLTPDQARQLMGLAAAGVRNAGRAADRAPGPSNWEVGGQHEDQCAR
jgi:hypothetical protein